MNVIANRQLHSVVYGSLVTNESADIPNSIAQDLLKRKLVRLPDAIEPVAEAPVHTAPGKKK